MKLKQAMIVLTKKLLWIIPRLKDSDFEYEDSDFEYESGKWLPQKTTKRKVLDYVLTRRKIPFQTAFLALSPCWRIQQMRPPFGKFSRPKTQVCRLVPKEHF